MAMAVTAAAAGRAESAVVKYEFVVEEWIVDFMRPTATSGKRPQERQTPFKIDDDKRKAAIMVNGQYPGQPVEVFENDTVMINVVNKMISDSTSIHWHGIHPFETPWTDGAVGVTQAPILPGKNFTYTFKAWPAGTHYWHSHMDGMQSAKGMRGSFIVKKRNDTLEQRFNYTEERVLVLSDEWRDPDVCLKLEGAMAGNDVCSDVEYASLNGRVATGNLQRYNKKYPYPLVELEKGKCYRLRIIAMMSNVENYILRLAGHNMTLVALDGVEVDPIMVSTLNMHIGERADVIVCADQAPGYYPLEMLYDYACDLTPGHFIPPGFHPVSSCKFYGFLHYANETELTYGAPTSPKGTGGGANPTAVAGVGFDLTNPWSWNKTKPVEVMPEPEEPDVRYVVTLGLQGPLYNDATDEPLTRGRWYMDIDDRRWTWKAPETPLLHTKGQCGAAQVPVLDIPETAVNVEIVLNNLSPTAHNIHMHGMLFQVINIADFQWCNVNKTACFLMPEQANPCPAEDRGISDKNWRNKTKGEPLDYLEDLYWGCTYNATKDKKSQNLASPLRKDSFQLWQRSWAVLRFKATFPGVWQFHCHMEQHIPLGMVFALNVLPSLQPKIPPEVPTEGPCHVWSEEPTDQVSALKHRVASLEQELATVRSDSQAAAERC